jgi:hypothetical protein
MAAYTTDATPWLVALEEWGLPRACPTHDAAVERIAGTGQTGPLQSRYCEVTYGCGCSQRRTPFALVTRTALVPRGILGQPEDS